ncbi:hypothetical protein PTKIN_Ptkin08bG0179900 [Pterospermum kingtungense]
MWRPPEGDVFKVNFDGALRVGDKMGGIGVIVRNSMGKFAMTMGFRKIVLEGDSIGVLKQLSLREQDLSAIGMVVKEGKVLLSHLDSCNIVHVLRDGNKVAHALAQIGVGQLHDVVWVEDYPPSIHDIISDDHVNQAFI